MSVAHPASFQEHEIDRQYQADECRQMVPVQRLSLEQQRREQREDGERHHLLNHLELHQRKGAAIPHEPDAVGGYLAHVFQKGDGPAEDHHPDEGQRGKPADLLAQFQVPIPGDGHKDVGDNEESDSVKWFHEAK